MAFCGNGNMILVCKVTLPCDQREVWVDVGYWTILCVSDSSWGIILSQYGLFWVDETLFCVGGGTSGVWDIILGT